MGKKTRRTPGSIDRAPSNPFEYTRPIIDPSRAIVRSANIQQVIRHIQRREYVSILAPRQTGKTTFLQQVRSALKDAMPDNCTVYIDFESPQVTDFASLIHYVALKVSDTCPGISFPEQPVDHSNFVRMLQDWAEEKPCTFLIDEVPSARALAFLFLATIRAYHQESLSNDSKGMHTFVIAGSTDLADLSREINPFVSPFNIAVGLFLDDFTHQEAATFIKQLASNRFTDDSIEKIVEYASGHPFLTQYLCYHLWDSPSQDRAQTLKSPDAVLKDLKLEDTVNIQSMIDAIWREPEHSKREIDLLRRVLQGERIRFSSSNRTVRNLVLQGCVVSKGGNCAIRNSIYEAVFKRNFAINDRIEPALSGREAQLERRPYEDYFKKLKNFDGWIIVSLWEGNKPLPYEKEEHRYTLRGDSQYELRVVIARGIEKPKVDGIVEELAIRDGEDSTDAIRFSVRPESFYQFDCGEEQTRIFAPHLDESMQTYKFPITTHNETPDEVQLFVNIYQDISLVQILKLMIRW
jgi:hypothetical protein